MNLPSTHVHGGQPVPAQGQAQAFPMQVMAPPPFFGGVSAEQKLELLEMWRSVVKRKWAILALALAVAVLAAIVSLAMTPIYRATATVLIEAGKGKVVSVEEVYSIGQAREHYQTQVELLKSREVGLRAVKALKLWDHPDFDPRKVRPSWSQRMAAALGMGDKFDADRVWTPDELAVSALKVLQADLTITPVRLSQLVQVHFESADPDLAARVANTVAKQYIENERDERYRMTTEVSVQLQDRLANLRSKLAESEKALQAYRESKGLVNLGGSAQANTSQQLSTLTERMLQARARRMELESAYNQIKGASPDTYASVPEVVRDIGVNEAQRAVTTASARVAELSTRLGPAHDQMIQARAELAEAQSLLRQRQRAIVRSVMSEYEAARSTEASLEASMNNVRGTAQNVNRNEFELAVLDREYQSNRQLYEMFMSRAKETSLVGDVQPAMARITDMAIAPDIPIKPKRSQIVLVAAMLALLLGAGAAVALDRLDNTVKGSDDAETRLRVPVLATLPKVEGATRKTMARAFLEDQHSHFSEGIRTARTGVLLSSLDSTSKVLLVTSCSPGEGKTTVAINLAMAHAHTGTPTLLIDCDMRRAQSSRALGHAGALRGLTALVSGTATLEQCVVNVRNTTLNLLPVGEAPPNPLELLHSQRFQETLEQLKQLYGVIIIDSPPVEVVSEALVLAPKATSVIMVLRAMTTPLPMARKSLNRIQRAGGKVLGLVVNGLDFSRARRYYGEYVNSTYSYGYGQADPGAESVQGNLDGDAQANGKAKPENWLLQLVNKASTSRYVRKPRNSRNTGPADKADKPERHAA
jgi:capsular exopolysaccharide synthesis family protein